MAAILPQVERLLVFDNGSGNIEEIEDSLHGVTLIRSSDNLGMAKALNRLAQAAADGGATDIVFLDQDSIADDGLVTEEARHRAANVGLVCPLVIDRNHRVEGADTNRVFETKRPVTSGSMVNLAAWKDVGGYDERLFVDWVDNEFCDNLRTHEYRLLKTHRTHILHELGHQEYAWDAPGRDDVGRSQANHSYYRQNYPSWRWRDRARSQALTIRKYGWSRVGIEEFILFLKATCGRVLLIERKKLVNLRALRHGLQDAWQCDHADEVTILSDSCSDHCRIERE